MAGWIRVSRIVATLLLAFMVWNEISTDSMVGNLQAEAASDPGLKQATIKPSARPATSGPDVLVAQPHLPPTLTPTPLPSPTVAPTPTLTTRALGVFTVTAYSDSPRNGTDGKGITKSGEPTHWGTVAVDPRVIPLGSHLKIEGMGETVFKALDTGYGVTGRWVDIWYSTDDLALQHGVKELSVQLILDK